MGKLKTKITISLLVAAAPILLSTLPTHAKYESNEALCLSESGRSHIESVQEACKDKGSGFSGNWCVAWIGGSNSTTIYASGSSGVIGVNIYGMCTDATDTTSSIWVTNDNGAFFGISNFERGLWGAPTSTTGSMDIGKFIDGLTPVDYGDYLQYYRTVYLNRCHSVGGHCSYQVQPVVVTVPMPTYTLSAVPVDYNTGADIISGSSWSTGPWKQGHEGYIDAANFTGYDFMGWKTGSYRYSNGVVNAGTDTRYKREMTSDYTIYPAYLRHKFSAIVRTSETIKPTNSANSGWVSDGNDGEGNINIECNNYDIGCTADFSIDLSRDQGNGKTTYIIYKTVTGADKKKVTEGTYKGSGGQFSYPNQKIYPGQTICYYVTFTPFGAKGNNHNATAKACAYAKPSYFKGKSSSGSSTTDWYNELGKTKTLIRIIPCNAKSGCKVNFKHELMRTAGAGTSNYTVERVANYWASVKGINIGATIEVVKNNQIFNASPNNPGTVSVSGDWTFFPGVVACETMTFYPDNNYANGNYQKTSTTKVCVKATGDAQPGDPTNPDNPGEDPLDPTISPAFINMKVKNNTVSTNHQYSKYQTNIYAKPDDRLTFRATYNPILQYAYGLRPEKLQIDNGSVYNNTAAVRTYELFNRYKTPGWNNDFSIKSDSFGFTRNYNYSPGDFNLKTETDSQTVGKTTPGSVLRETAITNLNNDTRTTPSQVKFSVDSNNSSVGKVITNEKSSTANVYVPYNFINTTNIITESGPVYAGESTVIEYNINIGTKTNAVTDGTYSTIVRNAQWKLRVCFNGNCYETTPETGNLNVDGSLNGHVDKKSTAITVPDAKAGTEVCVWSAVYPANSGADNNLDPSGNKTWQYSTASVCYTVAKKPNLEVWGGNIYTRGKINTSVTTKKHVYGTNSYHVDADAGISGYNTNYVFGSWGEYGVLSEGTINGFSSGAGLGFAANIGNAPWPNYHPADGLGNNANSALIANHGPGGSVESTSISSPCIRNTLTLANFPCDRFHQVLGEIGDSISGANITDNRDEIIARLAFNGSQNVFDQVILNDETKKRDYNIYYYYGGNRDLTVKGGTINNNTTQVVHSNGTITISENISYGDSFSTIAEIPKLVIYADNIIIDCNVTRLDALLIAKRNVKTCNSDDINARENSNQLVLTGAIIADSLTANRTYGAATGANSMIPAEIINFDPSLYSWGGDRTGEHVGDGKIETTYLYELAPRY